MKYYDKEDLKALIELHEIKREKERKEHGEHGEHDDGGVLTKEETTIIKSVFDLREINVTRTMIPIEKVFFSKNLL